MVALLKYPSSKSPAKERVLIGFFVCLFACLAPGAAAIDAEALDDPQLQARYVAIGKELRCLVCQNQSIQDSNADLAKDLRRQVRGMLVAGKTDDEIYTYMIERYGDYVRYRPPWRLNTLLLQLGPVFIALFGVWMLWGTLRRHRRLSASDAVNDEDRAQGAGSENPRADRD